MRPDGSKLRHGYIMTHQEQDGRIIAIISDGSPQHGNDPVTVLTLETFPLGTKRKVLMAWFKQMRREMPWVTRQ